MPEVNDPGDYMCPNCITPWKCNGPHIPDPSPIDEDPFVADRTIGSRGVWRIICWVQGHQWTTHYWTDRVGMVVWLKDGICQRCGLLAPK